MSVWRCQDDMARSADSLAGPIRCVGPASRRLIHLYERTELAPYETGPRAELRGVVRMIILTRLASEAGASVPNNMLACRVIQPDCSVSPRGREGRCQPAPISKPLCRHTEHARRSRVRLRFDVLACRRHDPRGCSMFLRSGSVASAVKRWRPGFLSICRIRGHSRSMSPL